MPAGANLPDFLAGPAGDARGVLLFGGTFDPPHSAHIGLSQLARGTAMPDGSWLVFVPAARSPHKHLGPSASDNQRVCMLQLALAGVASVAVWTEEIERAHEGGASFWVHTLRAARAQLGPSSTLRFLIGADQAASFHKWKDYREILRLAEPVVMLRPPVSDAHALDSALRQAGEWTPADRAWWIDRIVELPVFDTNATALRERLAAGESLGAEQLHPEVELFIREHGLYGTRQQPDRPSK